MSTDREKPVEREEDKGARGAKCRDLLDLSNLLWRSEDTRSLKKGREQLPEAEGWVVGPQGQT